MGTLIQEVQNLWEVDKKSASRGDKMGKLIKTGEKSANNINLWMVGGSSSVGMIFRVFQNLWDDDERSTSRGDSRGKMTNADQRNARDISGEVTNTRVVPIKNSGVMNVWDDMKQFNWVD